MPSSIANIHSCKALQDRSLASKWLFHLTKYGHRCGGAGSRLWELRQAFRDRKLRQARAPRRHARAQCADATGVAAEPRQERVAKELPGRGVYAGPRCAHGGSRCLRTALLLEGQHPEVSRCKRPMNPLQ
mmetsp:Transcript_124510/g.346624  ORF Transcript_124510/g.346624 Transcript_124510/m.346624 type:complete len:130 (+) Transcript_124510:81-470(+)